jgi:dethiobiotin synthetase
VARTELAFFIAGTDTGAGKTVAALALMAALAARGLRVAGMKPVASGCIETPDGLRNEDALALQAACSTRVPYEDVNPVALPEPLAPQIAAERVGRVIDGARIETACARLRGGADAIVVEGVGGWRVPIAEDLDSADLVRRLGLDVILVVGLRLGCINHALLTAEAIFADGLGLSGWIGNHPGARFEAAESSIAYLRSRLEAPFLGELPPLNEMDSARLAQHLDLAPLGLG